MEQDFELIFGLHSIAAALMNKQRDSHHIFATEDGLSELSKKHQINPRKLNCKVDLVSGHQLQETARKYCDRMDVEYTRVPSQIFLVTSPLQTYELQEILGAPLTKILALDQITDVHNGAAILRTASFYGIQGILLPSAKSFGLTPSFYRIASGATESVPLVRVNSLSRAIAKLNEEGFETVGLSEHAEHGLIHAKTLGNKICLILGSEELGLSHAVDRLVKRHYRLESQGSIKSLNVAAAAAVAMEKCFGV
jgi:23S rRNA (guanosine2251-2'-O)-methyltransferase